VRARLVLAAAAGAIAVVAPACGGGGEDKAGGTQGSAPKPLVLTLEQGDPDYGGVQFAAAVARGSGGSIRIDVDPEWHESRVDFERGIVEDVRAGRADLGVVGVRVWDTLGVTSLQALVAPFLVGSMGLQQRVLESPLAARMLAGVDRAGVVGLALLPGPLARPFGYRRSLVGPRDYAGARLGARPGQVEKATFASLGATTRNYLTLGGASREGAVLNLWAIAPSLRGRTLVGNVVFWPRTFTVFVNRRAFEALTSEQRAILGEAGQLAIAPRAAEVERLESEALRTICDRKLAVLYQASPANVAGLRAAVRPVYKGLERDARTKELIEGIKALGTGREEPLRCRPVPAEDTAALVGVWRSDAARDALVALGATDAEASTYEGPATLELKDSRWTFRGDHTTVTGTYDVEGNVIRLTMRTCTANPCSPGAVSEYVWSVYRDVLSLAPRPGGGTRSWPRLVAGSARRVG
jgi:TRAP-type C4-dicarboxylate transport system substrate-binding protein